MSRLLTGFIVSVSVALLGALYGCGQSFTLKHPQSSPNNQKSQTQPTGDASPKPEEEQSPTPSQVASPSPSPSPSPAVTDCTFSFPSSGYCANLIWLNTPTDQGENTFRLQFWKTTVGSAPGLYSDPPHSPFVMLWMAMPPPKPSHGSSPITLTQEKDRNGSLVPGVYDGSEVYFIMKGNWEVHVQLKDQKQVIEEAISHVDLDARTGN